VAPGGGGGASRLVLVGHPLLVPHLYLPPRRCPPPQAAQDAIPQTLPLALRALKAAIDADLFRYLDEMQDIVLMETGIRVSFKAILNGLKRIKLSRCHGHVLEGRVGGGREGWD